MVYAFDLATGAALRVESRNEDGTTYCETRYLSFSAGAPYVPQAGAGNVEMDEAVPAGEVDSEVLPDDLAGFRRADAYRGPEQSLVGYYSDGVFSFVAFFFALAAFDLFASPSTSRLPLGSASGVARSPRR